MRIRITLGLIVPFLFGACARADSLDGFRRSDPFGEQVREQLIDHVRIVIDASQDFDPTKSTLLIFYALPNGNSIEQTIGCKEAQGRDWHFYIQQIGAQTRFLRSIDRDRNIVIAYVEATADGVGKSWPAWRQQRRDNSAKIRQIIDTVTAKIPGKPQIALTAHSGGGSFIAGYLNSADAIDGRIVRIAYLDANYSYSDDEHHGDKLLTWLKDDARRHLVVIAYDDRNITFNGKPVVSATGGTWRASMRMIERFKQDLPLQQGEMGGVFDTCSAIYGQIRFFLHRNPKNEILHTRLVGEMSGFLAAMTLGTSHEHLPAETILYASWIAAEPIQLGGAEPQAARTAPMRASLRLPPRPHDAVGGASFIARATKLNLDQREREILREVEGGNVPTFLRALAPVDVKFIGDDGVPHIATYFVTPDYLSIGADGDFVRMPMLPATAQKIADLLDCSLPTRKMVDDIDGHAVLRLEPQPMTAQRESPLVFLEHNCLIEQQRFGRATGALICGIKKDIVITNRLKEKPRRVAIYGWRKLDGKPIQPLTIVHADAYVDYSHGVRLVARQMLVDGKPTTVDAVLKDPQLCGLLSDEGVIEKPAYR